jgi:uncharacterized membrane protein YfcA
VAAATSHFVLAFTAGAGTAAHIAGGAFEHGWRRTLAIGLGAILGAQIGAALAPRTRPRAIVVALSVGLALVGLRLVWGSLRGHA